MGISVRTSSRALGALFGTVGVLVLFSAMTASTQDQSMQVGLITAVVSLGLGVIVFYWGPRLSPSVFWVFHFIQSATIASGVALATDSSEAMTWASLFVLLLLESFFVLAWFEAGIEFIIAASLLVTALRQHDGIGLQSIGLLLGVLAATCGVTGWLVRAMALAESDSLTGVLNRRGMQRRIEEALHSRGVVLALLDLDQFKTVNDTLGHAGGDALLMKVAVTASRALPGSLTFGRWGGDEFAILGSSTDVVVEFTSHLRTLLPAPVGLSAGVAAVPAGANLDDLLVAADEVLYAVKRGGRGFTAVYSDSSSFPRDRRQS